MKIKVYAINVMISIMLTECLELLIHNTSFGLKAGSQYFVAQLCNTTRHNTERQLATINGFVNYLYSVAGVVTLLLLE